MPEARKEAINDALDTIEYLLDDIIVDIIDNTGSGFEKEVDEYSDSYVHESFVDRNYRPREAVDILEELDEFEETDSGLWEGDSDWRQILGTIAAHTYGNAVRSFFRTDMEALEEDLSDFPFTYEDFLKHNVTVEASEEGGNTGVFEGGPVGGGAAAELEKWNLMSEDEQERLNEEYEEELPGKLKGLVKRWIEGRKERS